MDSDQEEWIPLRQAVVEVANAYAPFMLCAPADALEAARAAILRRLTMFAGRTRAKRWVLYFEGSEKAPEQNLEGGEGTLIPIEFWPVFEQADCVRRSDWIIGEFSWTRSGDSRIFSDDERTWGYDAHGYALGVEIPRSILPIIGDENRTGELAGPALAQLAASERARRGRPPKWKWEQALCAVIAKANTPDGLPTGHGAQAEIGRMLAEWFRDNQGGEPAPSEIGARAAKIMQAIDAHNRK